MRFLLAYRFLKSKDNSDFINTISKISVIGIILGLSVLITVISVMNGFEQQLKNKVLGFTSHVTIYGSNLNTNEIISYFDQLVTDEDIDSYSVYFEDQALIISETGTSTAIVRAVNPQLESNVNIIDDNIISGFYGDLSNERSCHQKPENTKKNDICFECDCNYFPISTEVVLEDINFDNFYVPIDLLILNTYPFTNKIIYPPPKTSLFLS